MRVRRHLYSLLLVAAAAALGLICASIAHAAMTPSRWGQELVVQSRDLETGIGLAEFQLRNPLDRTVTIRKVSTTCSCLATRIVIDGEEQSSVVGAEIRPDQRFVLKVFVQSDGEDLERQDQVRLLLSERDLPPVVVVVAHR